MNDLINHRGIIDVSINLIRENPEGLLEVFKDILVTDMKVETNGIIHYRGLSKHFDLLKEGEEIPKYKVIITAKNEKSKMQFIRDDSECIK